MSNELDNRSINRQYCLHQISLIRYLRAHILSFYKKKKKFTIAYTILIEYQHLDSIDICKV